MTSNIEMTMQRRPGRPVGGDAEATRRRILAAGQETFADVGYEATTFMAIGNRAGVTRPAVNHYFPSKSVLYRTVLGVVTDRVAEAADTASRAPTLTDQLLGDIADVIVNTEPSTARFLLQSANRPRAACVHLLRSSQAGTHPHRSLRVNIHQNLIKRSVHSWLPLISDYLFINSGVIFFKAVCNKFKVFFQSSMRETLTGEWV